MKVAFYEEWFEKRLKKVIDIFGKDWFVGKSILELGSCYGNFGIEFIKMGSKVTFCDARIEYLEVIKNKLYTQFNFDVKNNVTNTFAKVIELNQNNEYDLNEKYDLVIHFGVLYHIENWKQDLKNALNHTNLMLLETNVYPDNSTSDYLTENTGYCYDAYKSSESFFTEKSVEKTLTNLGAKFVRLDTSDLNCSGWSSNNTILHHVYDWTQENYKIYNCNLYEKNKIFSATHYNRFWLVIK